MATELDPKLSWYTTATQALRGADLTGKTAIVTVMALACASGPGCRIISICFGHKSGCRDQAGKYALIEVVLRFRFASALYG